MKTSRFLQMFSRIYAISFVIALVGTVLCAALWNVFVGSSIRILLIPGMFLAVLILPKGIDETWPFTFLIVSALLNAFIFAWPLKWLWELRERYQFHKKAEEGLSPHGKIDD